MLTVFGTCAVAAMFLFYCLEKRLGWFVLAFAGACAASSAYGVLIKSYPFGIIEAAWALVALQRFFTARNPPRWESADPKRR